MTSRVTTAAEVLAFISQTYSVELEKDGIATLKFDLGNGRTQLVWVGVAGEHTLVATSPFAKKSDISAEKAFSVSKVHKPVATVGDYYAHSSAFPLKNLQPEEVLYVIEFVTDAADESEKELGLGDAL